jgi:fatty-acyl-CoA synthase
MTELSTRKGILEFEKQPLPELSKSVYEVLANSTQKYANRKALHFFLQGKNYDKPSSYTYQQLFEKVNATANMFRDLGIGDKDIVTYILPNLPETLFTVYGGETAGIVNAINPLLDPEHIIDIMNAAGSKILVTLAPFPKTDLWDKALKVIEKVPSLETVLTINLGDHLGFLARTLVGLTNKKPKVNGKIRLLDFNKTLKKYATDKLTFQRNIQPSDIASYFHTGGTTGRPKIAQHTHDNEVFNAWSLNNALGLEGYKVFFCGLPWFHVNGVIVTGLLPLSGGNGIVLGSPSGYRGEGVMENFWKIVEHYKISFFSSVPTVLQMLLEVPIKGENISSLEYAFCGAAPLSVKLFNDFEAATGIKILEGYGFTEGTCANSANPTKGERKVGSIGLANPHHHLKIAIIDEETGKYVRDAATDEIGNIVARGRNVFPGYKEAIHNKNAFIDDGTHKWYNTGDLGREDADGYFWITGRKKELIIRGGHNIDPKSIEEPLSKHPKVAAVAAVGRPDKRVGELPAAYVELKPGQTVSIDELIAFAKENIKERAAIPKEIVIIDSLPLTAIGKIFKPTLSFLQIKDVFEKELKAVENIASAKVDVERHPQKGIVAKVNAKAKDGVSATQLAEDVKTALGTYTVKYELV